MTADRCPDCGCRDVALWRPFRGLTWCRCAGCRRLWKVDERGEMDGEG